MISWVVASHRDDVLASVLLPSLAAAERAGDQVVVVRDAPSMAAAYNQGGRRAVHPVRCYLHHDVRLLAPALLRGLLLSACRPDVGMVGVIGSETAVVPWWEGRPCGSVVDTRGGGPLHFGPGGHGCAYLDGLLLATAQPVDWDEGYGGWHLYDVDACHGMLAAGLPNICLPGGNELVEHVNDGPLDMRHLDGWNEALGRFAAKWGLEVRPHDAADAGRR